MVTRPTVPLFATGEKVTTISATGPAAGVTVAAGAAGNVDISLPIGILSRILEPYAVKSITGIPDGVVLVQFSFPDPTTLRVRVFNTTAAAITITAGSITAEVLVKGV